MIGKGIKRITNERISLYDLYPRTCEPFTLDEVLYIIDLFHKHTSLEDVSTYVKRLPSLISWFFLEYRPLLKDGTYDRSRSVKTESEVDEFDFEKHIIKKWDFILNENGIEQYSKEVRKDR